MAENTHKGIIFVVDEETEFRETIQEFLEDVGYLVLSARNSAEALSRMRGVNAPAVAVISPGTFGVSLIATMRADEQLAHIPILVVTARDRGHIPGADRILRKPLGLEELLQVIKELMSP